MLPASLVAALAVAALVLLLWPPSPEEPDGIQEPADTEAVSDDGVTEGQGTPPSGKPESGTTRQRAGPTDEAPPAAAVDPGIGDSTPTETAQDFSFSECNLVLISLTNLRADHLGVYGYTRPTSPHIDALARESLVFERCFSHASWTLPVAISLFTSTYPLQHGMMNRKDYVPVPPDTPMFIDALHAAGYLTGAFVGDRDYSPEYGHTSRFHHVYDAVNDTIQEDWHEYGVFSRTIPEAVKWIRGNRGRKFFAFVQAYDVHCPFAIPEENDIFDSDYGGEIDFTRCYWTFDRTRPITIRSEDGREEEIYLVKTNPRDGDDYEAMLQSEDIRHMIALYDGEILNADRHVGKLLDELRTLGLWEKTVVLLFSEHGDMLGKHGRFMRGGPLRGTFYDDVLRVPLILRHPHLRPDRVSGFVELVDLAPTVLDMAGLPAPQTFSGRSLRPLILEGNSIREHVLAGSAYTPKKTSAFFRTASLIASIRTDEWKLIRETLFTESGPTQLQELFHVSRDPGELQEVSEGNAAVRAELGKLLEAWLGEMGVDGEASELGEAMTR